jgi:hypothetical protein
MADWSAGFDAIPLIAIAFDDLPEVFSAIV